MAYSSAQKKLITVTERERDRVQRMSTQKLAARVSGYFAAQAATLERAFLARGYELKGDAAAGDFLPDLAFVSSVAETEKLSKIVKSAAVDIAGSTYASVESTLGITAAFDLNSRNTKVMLDAIGNRVKGTNAESLDRLRSTVLRGVNEGMGPDALARELVGQLKGWAGFEDLKRSRATTIARTETANAYSLSSLSAYESSGIIKDVICMDAPDCGWNGHNAPELANGTVRTIAEARAQPLSHPNCIRAFAPKVAGSKFVEAPGARKRAAKEDLYANPFVPTKITSGMERAARDAAFKKANDWGSRWGTHSYLYEQRQAIASYQVAGYRSMNATLRGVANRFTYFADTRETRSSIAALDSAMDAGPRLPSATVLSRGVDYDAFGVSNGVQLAKKVGQVVEEPGFLSTAAGQPFTQTVRVELLAPKGQRAVWMSEKNIRDGADNASELEVLLPRGTKFLIEEVTNPSPVETVVRGRIIP